MERAIKETQKLINRGLNGRNYNNFSELFSGHKKCYFWSNENISSYLDLVSFDGKNNALSVLASGDQAFNLISRGIMDIDTFDINELTEYFALGFKRAMILKYTYEEYVKVINILINKDSSLDVITDIFTELLPYMEKSHKEFWFKIIEYNYSVQKNSSFKINLISLLTLGTNQRSNAFINNLYLHSKKDYDKLRAILSSANITYSCVNATNIMYHFNKKYDFLLMSNIIDYILSYNGYPWGLETFKMFQKDLEKLMKNNGIIFMQYIFKHKRPEYVKRYIDFSSQVPIEEIKDNEIYVLGANADDEIYDGVVLKRVKK